jgi:hypothetical protein
MTRRLCESMKTNFRVRNCPICHLKSLDRLGLLVVFFLRRYRRCNSTSEEIRMNNKLVSCLIAGALGTTLALASPALARGGGGGGGMHGGGMGGGMHSGGMHFGGMSGGMHSGGMHFGGMSGGPHFSGARFASAPFAHHGFSPRSSRFAFRDHDHFHHRFFHHRFNRFAFFGAPYAYAAYNDCWRRVWTSYGPQWVDVCGDYGY